MLLGIIEAIWQGYNVPLKPGSTFELGGVSAKPQVVGKRVDYSQAMEPSNIDLNVAVEQGMKVSDRFPRGVAGELQIQCDSGQTFVWDNAFVAGTIQVSTGDNSEAKVKFAGGTPTELQQ